ncbi:uncharacterized protein BN736_01705 [Prevotella sp. CAG:617]|nr:uncharacterized protein BN736_01705 [Prevotella sp. CAG:617]
MDDVHGLVVHAGNLLEHFLVVADYFFKVQRIAGEDGDSLYHYGTGVFAASAIDGQQQGFSQVTAGSEELYLLTDGLIAYAAGNSVVVASAYFTHEVVVFVLDGAGVNRYLGAEALEAFGQFGTPQNGHVGFWRRTKVVKCLQETERGLRHLGTAVVEASAQ